MRCTPGWRAKCPRIRRVSTAAASSTSRKIIAARATERRPRRRRFLRGALGAALLECLLPGFAIS
jgi:hypothetical protein